MRQKFKQYILRRLHQSLTAYEQRLYAEAIKEDDLARKAIIGSKTIFSPSARIFNNLNDKSKITIGDHCLINGDLLVYAHGGNIQIGNFVFLGENSRIWSAQNITIGNNVLISHNVNIHDNNSHPLDPESRKEQMEYILANNSLPRSSFGTKEASITIEDEVWIGYNASIGKGVRIGKRAIISSGCYVYNDVPPYCIVMGNPGKVVSKLEST